VLPGLSALPDVLGTPVPPELLGPLVPDCDGATVLPEPPQSLAVALRLPFALLTEPGVFEALLPGPQSVACCGRLDVAPWLVP